MKNKNEAVEKITDDIIKGMDQNYLLGSALYCFSDNQLKQYKEKVSGIILKGMEEYDL